MPVEWTGYIKPNHEIWDIVSSGLIWEDRDGFILFKLESAYSFLAKKFDCIAIDGFRGFQESNRPRCNDFSIDLQANLRRYMEERAKS